ncbi:hypothetical protein [Nocardia sp. CA-119907]|uniref:hypothetical protein n=1 Tax=Nocardia sp. CA-119907 TaxID=3239973 RepID=UPI003D982448
MRARSASSMGWGCGLPAWVNPATHPVDHDTLTTVLARRLGAAETFIDTPTSDTTVR